MNEFVTPKQVARAIQVSESSVKRWCDKGVIPSQKTAGGHRRIPLGGLLDFLRQSDHVLVRPEVIGLPSTTGQTGRVVDRAAERLTEALIRGDQEQCRRIALDLYLADHRISRICDQVFMPAFESIGDQWECGEAHIYQERRACEIALRILHEIRTLLPASRPNAPLALGGTVAGDQYELGTTMAELVLLDGGWDAVSLGNNLPFATLAEAIRDHHPRLFWVSCSHLRDEAEFVAGYNELYEQFGRNTAFVVGGRALVGPLRQQMRYSAYCDNMQHLEAFAQTLRGPQET